jgi:hypothetical protein
MANQKKVSINKFRKWLQGVKKIKLSNSTKISIFIGLLLATLNYLVNLIFHPVVIFILTFLLGYVFFLLLFFFVSIWMSYTSSIIEQNQNYRKKQWNLHHQIIQLRQVNFELKIIIGKNRDIIENTFFFLNHRIKKGGKIFDN